METLKLGSTGPMVELLKKSLKRLGFYSNSITNVFDEETKNAVMEFQKKYELIVDGIVGDSTWASLSPVISGYTSYIIQEGDTLNSIAKKFFVNPNALLVANPSIIPNSLRIAQRIYIPFEEIVPTNISYSYEILKLNIDSFLVLYPFLEIGYIGTSSRGARIPFIRIGTGSKEVFYNGSFHANEWITSPLLMKYTENFCKAYVNGTDIFGYDPKEIFENVSIYIMPMVNPDGVNLVTGALSEESGSYQSAKRISGHYPTIPFPDGWKANIQRN